MQVKIHILRVFLLFLAKIKSVAITFDPSLEKDV